MQRYQRKVSTREDCHLLTSCTPNEWHPVPKTKEEPVGTSGVWLSPQCSHDGPDYWVAHCYSTLLLEFTETIITAILCDCMLNSAWFLIKGAPILGGLRSSAALTAPCKTFKSAHFLFKLFIHLASQVNRRCNKFQQGDLCP